MDKAIHTDKHGTETTKAKVDQLLLREKIRQLREKGYEQEMRSFVLDAKEKQLEYEYRYNHYHDPHNGRFASGAGGGVGLYYSEGKGKGYIKSTGDGEKIDLTSESKNAKIDKTDNTDTSKSGKKGVKLPVEDYSYGYLDNVNKYCVSCGIKAYPVKQLDHELTEREIIERVGGPDKTDGSCTSLAYAYAANKAGYDVLDFRGGESREAFAQTRTAMAEAIDGTISVKKAYNLEKIEFIESLPDGEEYVFRTGKHAAIVRQKNGKAQYLELQDEKKENGWHNLNTTSDMDYRFGWSSDGDGYTAVNIKNVVQAKGFRRMMTFINTPADEQQKGEGGYAK